MRVVGTVPLLVQFTVAPALLALGYRYYYLNEDGEAGLQGDQLTIWTIGSALIWLFAAALLVVLWRRRNHLVAWLVPPAWFVSSEQLHEYLVGWPY
jgi:hypothetical protein